MKRMDLIIILLLVVSLGIGLFTYFSKQPKEDDHKNIIVNQNVVNETNNEVNETNTENSIDVEEITIQTISGKVTEVSKNTITIKTGGKTYVFSIANAEKENVSVNDTVTISYEGTLEESSVITAIKIEQ